MSDAPTAATSIAHPAERPVPAELPAAEQVRAVRIVAGILAPLIVALAFLGAIGSFTTVRMMAEPWFGGHAWIVPVGMDVGILVLLAWDLLMEYLGMPWPMLRWVAWGYIAATVAVNVAAARGDPAGSLMHAAMPTLFITAIEGIRHLIRRRVGLATGTRPEPIPTLRWLLAPLSTVLLWRQMALWHITSYREALDLEHRRLIEVGRLQQRYGRLAWRWRAPLPERLNLRLLAVNHEPPEAAVPAQASPELEPPTPDWLNPELLLAARHVLRDGLAEGRVLSRTELGQQLRKLGFSISNERLAELRQLASAGPTATRTEP
ncbi:DUF2637 domain-containing protein [Actinomadura oligospora]|uniref:DUF2637 domain-containing protein n=1 Tax=Actinomadura oligospora TaxID=111804 RepID=UPI0004AD4C04|nr:DUF2637 domain-containing protein [Actinomadura oligospora]